MDKFENSPRDEREDKTLAKLANVPMKAWELSNADKVHDNPPSMNAKDLTANFAKAKKLAMLMAGMNK